MHKLVVAVTVAVGVVLGAAGCSQLGWGKQSDKFPLEIANEKVPAAKGVVEVSRGSGGNQDIKIKVEHMAPPANVNPDATAYIVWLKPAEGGPVQNLGILRVDSNRKGSFSGTTPFRQFQVFVTPEPHADVSEPNGQQVLRASVQPTGSGTF